MFDPFRQAPRQGGADSPEFGHRAAACQQFDRLHGPHESGVSRPAERLFAVSLGRFSFADQQLRDGTVIHPGGKYPCLPPQPPAATPERRPRSAAQAACAKFGERRDARGELPINVAPPEAIAGCASGGHAWGPGQSPRWPPFRSPGVAPSALPPFSPFAPLFPTCYEGVRIFGSVGRAAFSRPGWAGSGPSLSAVISSLVLLSSRTSRAASYLSIRARSNNGPSDTLTRFATPVRPSNRTIVRAYSSFTFALMAVCRGTARQSQLTK